MKLSHEMRMNDSKNNKWIFKRDTCMTNSTPVCFILFVFYENYLFGDSHVLYYHIEDAK